MARELGPQGIHVAHVVIDGGIRSSTRADPPDRPRQHRSIRTCHRANLSGPPAATSQRLGLGNRSTALARAILKLAATLRYNHSMEFLTKAALVALALAVAASGAHAQGARQKRDQRTSRQSRRRPRYRSTSATVLDCRARRIQRPPLLACSRPSAAAFYFKLNKLYTAIAVRALVVKPDPRTNAEYSKKLTEAMKDGDNVLRWRRAFSDD